jgi:DNA-binding NarL/FixJ family response regulator
MKTITIMVVASAGVVRDGYQALFGAIDGLSVLKPEEETDSAVARLAAEKPDLVIIEAGVDTIDARSILSAARQSVATGLSLVICPNESYENIYLEFGADATVVDGIPPAELSAVVKRLAMDLRWICR